ncbi:MAG: DNA polymerase Y family protein [Candidatus Binatia bacterium]|jgi:protein ImuB
MRLACLYVPDFPLAALLRAEPDLIGTPLAVVDELRPLARLKAISAEAVRRGVTVDLTTAQAEAIAVDLTVRQVAPGVLRAAQAALCDAAESFTPRVEDAGDGIAYLDLEGLGALFESESRLANALAQRVMRLGLEARIGVAGSKVAAYLAACHGGGITVIPPGEEWHFLAPVPIRLLGPGPELAATLQRWGIRCIGDLAALTTAAVGARLGPEGVSLVRRARGEDERPLVPRPLPLQFEEGVEIEYDIEALEPLLFVLRGLLDRLITRLALRGFICGDLRLSLRLANRGRDERTIAVAAPSNEVKSLLALVRLQLETHPPTAAIAGVHIAVVAERLRAAQLDLFRPNGPAPARLAVTLARLTAICGADRVGAPAVADTHRPDAYGMKRESLIADRLSQETNPSLAIRDSRYAISDGSAAIPLALRALRPPQAVEVFCERDRPDFVRGDRLAGRVVHAAGPWRVQGEWWSESGYARDYYDAQLSDGCVYRLYCDLGTRSWFVDGVYD